MARSEILNLLPVSDGSKSMETKEIHEHSRMSGIGLNSIKDALKQLFEEEGLIQRSGAGNGASPHRWWRPEQFTPIV